MSEKIVDKMLNYSFDNLLKYIKEKKKEERRKEKLRLIFMI
jgi:hypothetical protein